MLSSRVDYVEIGNERPTRRGWINFPISEGWKVGFRVRYQTANGKREARLVEMKIVPCRSDEPFVPNWGYEEYKHRAWRALRTIERFSWKAFHRAITERHVRDALAAVDAMGVGNYIPSRLESPRRKRGAGRPGRGLSFYARFAIQYDAVENSP
jgi:hypothetical protein